MAEVETETMPSDPEREVIFEAEVVVTGWKFIWAMCGRSRKLRITDSEILIENLPAIPLISITNCRIRFTCLQLEFVDNLSATMKLMIRAPVKYHFRQFPVNYMDEHEFIENLYDAIIEAIPKKSAIWSSLKDAKKDLSTNKLNEIKRDYAEQVRCKRILSLVLLPLTFLWGLFIVVTQILDLISLGEYETFVTFVLFLIFPIMFGLAFVNINHCPHCKALFISTPKFCRKCRVPLIDEDSIAFYEFKS